MTDKLEKAIAELNDRVAKLEAMQPCGEKLKELLQSLIESDRMKFKEMVYLAIESSSSRQRRSINS